MVLSPLGVYTARCSSFPPLTRAATRSLQHSIRRAAVPLPIRSLSTRSRTSRPNPTTSQAPQPTAGLLGIQWQRPAPARAGIRAIFSGHFVPRHYVDLPPNYKDEAGVSFRKNELEADEVLSVFGPAMGTLQANKLLRILHGRRVAGTLDDPVFQHTTSLYSRTDKAKAMEWLRKNVPVDEVMNAGLRAEDELKQLEEEMDEFAEPLSAQEETDRADSSREHSTAAEENGTKKHNPGYSSRYKLYKEAPVEESKSAPGPDDVYGQGAFDRIRARNRARNQAEMKRREEERKRREEEEKAAAALNPGKLQKVGENEPRELSPAMQRWVDAATSDLKEPPKMAMWERILPSALVVALITAALVAYAEFYSPPSPEHRLWPDIPPAAATLAGIIVANAAFYVAWRLPPLYAMMNRYFLMVAATPRPLSMVGAIFSHQKLSHLATNMLFLWFFGIRLHDEVGRGDFLATYVASGSFGFLATLTSLVVRGRLDMTSLGASGAIYGVATAYFWMHRFEGFKILGLPPDPYNGIQGLGFIGLMLAVNVTALFSRGHLIDVASHLMGMAVGGVAGHLLQKKAESRRLQEGRRTDMGVAERLMEKKG